MCKTKTGFLPRLHDLRLAIIVVDIKTTALDSRMAARQFPYHHRTDWLLHMFDSQPIHIFRISFCFDSDLHIPTGVLAHLDNRLLNISAAHATGRICAHANKDSNIRFLSFRLTCLVIYLFFLFLFLLFTSEGEVLVNLTVGGF